MKKYFFITFLFLTACAYKQINTHAKTLKPTPHIQYIGYIERLFMKAGLVDIQQLNQRFFVSLSYSDTANFLHKDVYGKLNKCYLHPQTAAKLLMADSILQASSPSLHFLIYDGARPHYIQQVMYNLYKKMPVAQGLYLSHPNNHSLHNYGAAVDLTICDSTGIPLDMGTDFDHFGPESHISNEWELKQSGKISPAAFENRKLLRRIMLQAKFTPITYEWWHFNACSRNYAATHYTLIQ